MKRRLASNSGMTLIEIVLAMLFLLIMIVVFTKLYAFTGTTVNYAGQDSSASAGARSEVNNMLATPVDPNGDSTDASIAWNGGSDRQVVSVVRESAGVPALSGEDSQLNIYRRPAQERPEPPEPKPPEVIDVIDIVIIDQNAMSIDNSINNYGNGVPAADIVTPDIREHLLYYFGSEPDYWRLVYDEDRRYTTYNGHVIMDYSATRSEIWDSINGIVKKSATLYPYYTYINESTDDKDTGKRDGWLP